MEQELNRDATSKRLEAKHNPFNHLQNLRKAHDGISHWLDLALAAVRKDKRSEVAINIKTYLNDFQNDVWREVLKARKTHLSISSNTEEELELKGFLIDVDSIFNNLLINSFDAFDRKGFSGKRDISIGVDIVYSEEDEIDYMIIDYADSGPGLDQNIKNPYVILRRGYTTKKNEADEEIGTGLGMWIIGEAVSYYDGLIEILTPEKGFQLKIRIPYKNKRT